MTPKQKYNALLGQKLVAEFEKRNFEGYYCETKEAALKKALELLPKEALVSCGGSATLYEIGLIEALKSEGYNFLDPRDAQGAKKMDAVAHEALSADYFLMSANAITESGELVNADGYGNRVSALIFGPKNVIVIAGVNKVVHDVDAAVVRVKKYATRMILLKFSQDYLSLDALDKTAEEAVGQLVITSKTTAKGRIKVIVVGEALGF